MKNTILALCFTVTLFTTTIQAAITGVWNSEATNYILFLESTNHDVISVQLSQDMTTSNIYLGNITNQDLLLNNIANDNILSATLSEDGATLTGTLTESSEVKELLASLVLTYVGSDFDGIWKTNTEHYLVYFTAQNNSDSELLSIVVDVLLNESVTINDASTIEVNGESIEINGNTITINNGNIEVNGEVIVIEGNTVVIDGETIEVNGDNAQIEVFIGSISGNSYTGTSRDQATKKVTLDFTTTELLNGTYVTKTIARPPVTTEEIFTAERIFITK